MEMIITVSNLFKVLDSDLYFEDAQTAQEYAKNNLGTTIVRCNDNTLTKNSQPISNYEAKMDITPSSILEHLNKHLVAQDKAKKDIALSIYYHQLKSKYKFSKKINKNGPLMLVGPTGSGKTFIVQKACEYVNTSYVHVNTANMVPDGIMGYSIEDLGKEILEKSKGDLHKAKHCIVFLDEIDKLFLPTEDASNYGPKIASQLLRLIEGGELKMSYSQTEHQENDTLVSSLDCSNMQFILGGAFQWILDEKQNQENAIGFFEQDSADKSNEITLDDLYQNDIPKELLGRMRTIVNLFPLSEEDYYAILTTSESSPLREYIQKIEFHNNTVTISPETLKQVAHYASESELGVRALKQVLEVMFKDAMFNAPATIDTNYTILY